MKVDKWIEELAHLQSKSGGGEVRKRMYELAQIYGLDHVELQSLRKGLEQCLAREGAEPITLENEGGRAQFQRALQELDALCQRLGRGEVIALRALKEEDADEPVKAAAAIGGEIEAALVNLRSCIGFKLTLNELEPIEDRIVELIKIQSCHTIVGLPPLPLISKKSLAIIEELAAVYEYKVNGSDAIKYRLKQAVNERGIKLPIETIDGRTELFGIDYLKWEALSYRYEQDDGINHASAKCAMVMNKYSWDALINNFQLGEVQSILDKATHNGTVNISYIVRNEPILNVDDKIKIQYLPERNIYVESYFKAGSYTPMDWDGTVARSFFKEENEKCNWYAKRESFKSVIDEALSMDWKDSLYFYLQYTANHYYSELNVYNMFPDELMNHWRANINTDLVHVDQKIDIINYRLLRLEKTENVIELLHLLPNGVNPVHLAKACEEESGVTIDDRYIKKAIEVISESENTKYFELASKYLVSICSTNEGKRALENAMLDFFADEFKKSSNSTSLRRIFNRGMDIIPSSVIPIVLTGLLRSLEYSTFSDIQFPLLMKKMDMSPIDMGLKAYNSMSGGDLTHREWYSAMVGLLLPQEILQTYELIHDGAEYDFSLLTSIYKTYLTSLYVPRSEIMNSDAEMTDFTQYLAL